MLAMFLCFAVCALPARSWGSAPEAFADLPAGSYQSLDAQKLREQWSGAADLLLPDGRQFQRSGLRSFRFSNGDIGISGFDQRQRQYLRLTIGAAAIYGDLHGPDGHQLISTDRHGSWLISLPDTGLSYNQCGLDDAGAAAVVHADKHKAAGGAFTDADSNTVIDLLLIYNRALARRYPGEMLETRLNHLVRVADEAMAHSGIDLRLQMVGHAQFNYANFKSNLQFRNDIAATLGGDTRAGLEGLRALRNQLGADLVIGLRPHDIEKRGNCGIAFFPDDNPNIGVNVVSDGMSSWSVCLDDTLTHEIGHNLGAAHQAGQGGGYPDPRGAALVRAGRYSTIMSSFGTGRPDRFRGLRLFSNPLVDCGGQACGLPGSIDNAAVISEIMGQVSAYRPNSISLPETTPVPVPAPDSDADGVNDWQDFFPFDALEVSDTDGDGAGDLRDAFPFNALEQADSDQDGQGDNADSDDDNDVVPDLFDAFPYDPLENADSDGDGVGDEADAFALDASEQSDLDADGIGDHADADDDGDGLDEFDPVRQDLLVISAGNNRVLRFDAETGEPRGIEITGQCRVADLPERPRLPPGRPGPVVHGRQRCPAAGSVEPTFTRHLGARL